MLKNNLNPDFCKEKNVRKILGKILNETKKIEV